MHIEIIFIIIYAMVIIALGGYAFYCLSEKILGMRLQIVNLSEQLQIFKREFIEEELLREVIEK